MDRRSMLAGVAGVAGLLAGCSGSDDTDDAPTQVLPGGDDTPTDVTTPEPTPVPMEFPDYTFEGDDDGDTVVVLTINNPGPETRETTMNVIVKGPDGEKRTRSTDVSIEPDEEKTYRVAFDVDWSWFRDNTNLQGVTFADAE